MKVAMHCWRFAISVKRFLIAILILVLVAPAFGDTPSPGDSQLQEHDHYVNHDGHVVHSPAHSRSGNVPASATAKCGDGTYSFSQHHSGTCSHHGGVAEWE